MNRRITSTTNCNNIDSIPYLAFPLLEQFPFIRHGFSTRHGGVSKGYFSSMNLGFRRGDTDENVMENYRRLCDSVGVKREDLVFTDQTHTANVRVATACDKGKGILIKRDYQDIDGQITNEPFVPLLVFGADCVPVFFVDPIQKAIGLSHAGWKGTCQKIAAVTVEKMKLAFSTKPEDLFVVIGPSIGAECYEIGMEVVDAFQKNFLEKQWSLFLQPGEKYHLDLWEANRQILLEAGVKSEQIAVSGVCTSCRQDLLFSHRVFSANRGSMAAILSLV